MTTTITALPAATSLTGTEMLEVDQGSTTGRTTAAQIGYLARRGTRILALGDSITEGGVALSYYDLFCLLAQGKILRVNNMGRSGNTTADMLARLSTDVLSYAGLADWIVVMAGTNDIGGAVPIATTIANLTSIYTQCRAVGIEPILIGISPHQGHTNVPALNEWIRGYAQKNGHQFVDFYPPLVDPAANSGAWLAPLYLDGIHPTLAAVHIMANLLVNNLLPMLGTAQAPSLVTFSADPANLLPNGCFTASASGVPTSWGTITGTGAGIATSVVADTATVPHGNLWQMVGTSVAALTEYGLTADLTTGFSVGDRISFSGRLLTSGAEAGSLIYGIQLRFLDATNTLIVTDAHLTLPDHFTDIADGVFHFEFTVPTATAKIRPVLRVVSGSGTVRFGQMTIRNKTVLGLP